MLSLGSPQVNLVLRHSKSTTSSDLFLHAVQLHSWFRIFFHVSKYPIFRHYCQQSVGIFDNTTLFSHWSKCQSNATTSTFFFNPIKSKNREQPAGWQNSFTANIDSSCNPIGSPLFFKSIWYLVCVRLRRKENNACYSFFRHKSWLL